MKKYCIYMLSDGEKPTGMMEVVSEAMFNAVLRLAIGSVFQENFVDKHTRGAKEYIALHSEYECGSIGFKTYEL